MGYYPVFLSYWHKRQISGASGRQTASIGAISRQIFSFRRSLYLVYILVYIFPAQAVVRFPLFPYNTEIFHIAIDVFAHTIFIIFAARNFTRNRPVPDKVVFMQIALVEDLKEDRETLRRMLTDETCSFRCYDDEISSFPDGESFLKEFSKGKYDLIFLDIFLTELSGVETAKNVREADPDVHIVFITTSNDYASESYDVGADFYLLKPFTKEKFDRMASMVIPRVNKSISIVTFPDGTRLSLCTILYSGYAGHYATVHYLAGPLSARHSAMPASGHPPASTRNPTMLSPDLLRASAHNPATLRTARHPASAGNVSRPAFSPASFRLRISYADLRNLLCRHDSFCGCCKGIIVNFAYVESVRKDQFVMKDGALLPISRRKLAEVKRAYADYVFNRL